MVNFYLFLQASIDSREPRRGCVAAYGIAVCRESGKQILTFEDFDPPSCSMQTNAIQGTAGVLRALQGEQQGVVLSAFGAMRPQSLG